MPITPLRGLAFFVCEHGKFETKYQGRLNFIRAVFSLGSDMSGATKRPVGRPSELTPEVIEKAWAYLKGGYQQQGNAVPSVAGLAFGLGKHRDTMYEWADQNAEFSDILKAINTAQEMLLIDGALTGDFNAPFTKLLMTKHGYSDKMETDVTSKGEAVVMPSVIELVVPHEGQD